MPVSCLLLCGADYASRERYLAGWLRQHPQYQRASIILEGLPGGQAELSELPQVLSLQRLASGCLCCAGKLVFQVSIQRSLRSRPDFVAIAIDRAEHLSQLHELLSATHYANHLSELITCNLDQVSPPLLSDKPS